jgi:hypothetical protein
LVAEVLYFEIIIPFFSKQGYLFGCSTFVARHDLFYLGEFPFLQRDNNVNKKKD